MRMSASMMSVDELVRLLRGLRSSQLEAEQIEELLTGAVLDRSSLSPYLFRRVGCYARNLVYRNDQFEMLALVWDAGACSPIHDHAGQECFFSVQEGSFQQEDFELLEGGRRPGDHAVLNPVPRPMTLTPGKVDHRRPDGALHRILNVGNSGGVSLHVYSKPIDRCLIYDRRGNCSQRDMQYDSVWGKALREGLFHLNPLCNGVPLTAH
jgi:cysteine dioxygenase